MEYLSYIVQAGSVRRNHNRLEAEHDQPNSLRVQWEDKSGCALRRWPGSKTLLLIFTLHFGEFNLKAATHRNGGRAEGKIVGVVTFEFI